MKIVKIGNTSYVEAEGLLDELKNAVESGESVCYDKVYTMMQLLGDS